MRTREDYVEKMLANMPTEEGNLKENYNHIDKIVTRKSKIGIKTDQYKFRKASWLAEQSVNYFNLSTVEE